jgi:hypothetical protein
LTPALSPPRLADRFRRPTFVDDLEETMRLLNRAPPEVFRQKFRLGSRWSVSISGKNFRAQSSIAANRMACFRCSSMVSSLSDLSLPAEEGTTFYFFTLSNAKDFSSLGH